MKMGTSRKAVVLAAVAGVVAVAAAGAAFAGYTAPAGVTVTSTYMSGGLSAARSAPNSTEYIRCYVNGFSGDPQVGCSAKDAAGTFKSCTTYRPAIAHAATAINSSSYLNVYFTGSECTQLIVYNGSQYLP